MATAVALEAKVFGESVRRLREKKDWSQQKLANAAGLTTNFLSDVERGVKVASLTTILKLAHALEESPAALFADFTPNLLRRIAKI